MKLGRADFKQLRLSIAVLVVALLAGAGLSAAAYLYQQQAFKDNRIAQAQRDEMKGKLTRAAQEEVELRDKIARFQDFQARGFIGRENRLDWVEQISRLGAERKLIDLGYEFLPQRAVDATLMPGGAALGGYTFMTSTQRATLKLLHEGDLLGMLDDFRRNIRALILVRSCSIERNSPDAASRGPTATLRAECNIEWITARPPL